MRALSDGTIADCYKLFFLLFSSYRFDRPEQREPLPLETVENEICRSAGGGNLLAMLYFLGQTPSDNSFYKFTINNECVIGLYPERIDLQIPSDFISPDFLSNGPLATTLRTLTAEHQFQRDAYFSFLAIVILNSFCYFLMFPQSDDAEKVLLVQKIFERKKQLKEALLRSPEFIHAFKKWESDDIADCFQAHFDNISRVIHFADYSLNRFKEETFENYLLFLQQVIKHELIRSGLFSFDSDNELLTDFCSHIKRFFSRHPEKTNVLQDKLKGLYAFSVSMSIDWLGLYHLYHDMMHIGGILRPYINTDAMLARVYVILLQIATVSIKNCHAYFLFFPDEEKVLVPNKPEMTHELEGWSDVTEDEVLRMPVVPNCAPRAASSWFGQYPFFTRAGRNHETGVNYMSSLSAAAGAMSVVATNAVDTARRWLRKT